MDLLRIDPVPVAKIGETTLGVRVAIAFVTPEHFKFRMHCNKARTSKT